MANWHNLICRQYRAVDPKNEAKGWTGKMQCTDEAPQ
jgi:hypothetical protein